MTNANNDVRELEDLLTELEGQGALPAGPYSDEDDAVTQLMDAPVGEQEWMVQITPLDRRMMSTEQLVAEIGSGNLVQRDMLVWRAGMSDWAPIARVDELTSATLDAPPLASERRPLPPPPTPIPPPRASSALGSPGALSSPNGAPPPNGVNGVHSAGRAPLPPVPSPPFGAPKSLTPVPDVPASALPLLNSAFGSPGVPPVPPAHPVPEPSTSFNIPPPAAAPNPPSPSSMRMNTPRPVAVDFSEMGPVRTAPTKILIGSGVAALCMIIGTVYALSAGGVFESTGPEVSHEPAGASKVAAAAAPKSADSKPAESKSAESKPAESKSAEAKPAAAAAKPEAPKPSADSDGDVGKGEPQTQPVSTKEEMVAAPEPKETKTRQKLDGEPKARAEKAEEASSSDDAASESSHSSRAERRMAARLRKRAAAEEGAAAAATTAAPRRDKPRAAAAAASVSAEADESPKGGDAPGSTFNKQAAKTALDDAAAQAKNCRPQGGLTGSGKVQVRYEPTGKVGAVSILTPQFDNTTTGSCLVMVFRRASIPPFAGSPPVVMNKSFEIP